MSDSDIRRELDENLLRYERNVVLNKLTPNKRSGSDISSLRAGTRSSSRRTTPGRLGRRPGHNDSNILTSPVKTLRRYRTQSSDGEEMYNNNNGDADDSLSLLSKSTDKSQRQNVTVVPLNDSSKEPMRKGTPKKLSAASSKKESPAKSSKTPLKQQKSKSFTLFKDIVDLPAPSNKIQDDDDVDDHRAFGYSNDTLMSDIPSDLLSPEKHVYPQENITSAKKKNNNKKINGTPNKSVPSVGEGRSPVTRSTAKKTRAKITSSSPIAQSQDKPSLYPDLTSVASHDKNTQSPSNRVIDKIPTLTLPATSSLITTMNNAAPVSPAKSNPKSKSPTPATSKSPVSRRTNHSKSPTLQKQSQPTIFPDLRSSPRKRVAPVAEGSPLRSPARRLPATSTTLGQAIENRLGGLDPAIFDSSDEEPVPELTVPINMQEINDSSTMLGTKRKQQTSMIVETTAKKQKTFSIYPDLDTSKVDQSLEKTTADSPANVTPDLLNSSILKGVNMTTKLYPSLLSPVAKSESNKEELGDADNWTQSQWTKFAELYEKFDTGGHDFTVFDTSMMEYLRCDYNELLMKIEFYKEFLESHSVSK
ncbi:hypothetical protein BON22_1091 [Cyberlindnera fabianii]|uniref:Uncharacterized protein n=1 Tax=Cyberlindnera fabianii TaxID=36022 RepID=A0A1V2L9I8_CYBFA|nr:hypothetical protein BON22_1091 [Cyberlindnera fabianii]